MIRSPAPDGLQSLEPAPPAHRRRAGVTLLELIVVLVLLTLAAGVAAPALLSPRPTGIGFTDLISHALALAARRGETVRLRVGESGEWRMDGAASAEAGPLHTGRVMPFPGLPLTLIVSPVGSCGFDAPSAAARQAIRLDPMSCTVLD